MFTLLQLLVEKGAIRQLDYQFARFIASQAKQNQDELGFIAAALSQQLSSGHICLQLNTPEQPYHSHVFSNGLANQLGLFGESAEPWIERLAQVDWMDLLEQSELVRKTNGADGNSTQIGALPLVFDEQRLYLQRYWFYEVALAARIGELAQPVELTSESVSELTALLNHLFKRSYHFLFNALKQLGSDANEIQRQQLVLDHLDVVNAEPLDWPAINQTLISATRVDDLEVLEQLVPQSTCVNWQKVAASVALTRRFAVISGGPGTGKTTTVTKLLAALITQSQQAGSAPLIKLVAPTGKAAARLTESIGAAVEALPVSPELKAAIPTDSSTLHRLLGAIPGSVEFRHHQDNPLHLDILVVDEASMVDLSMMYKLVEALPKNARLILLGDKDQLSSVEAGAVLGDICSFSQYGYSANQSSQVATLTGFTQLNNQKRHVNSPIADSLCMLQKSYRFDARSGIGQLAKAVNMGQVSQLEKVWQSGFTDIEHYPLSSQHYNHMLQTLVKEYGVYLKRLDEVVINPETQNPETQRERAKAALKLFGRCRLLCAIREGDFGVAGLNSRVERALSARKLIRTQDELWYHGRPIMVTRNDHGLGLYNGDIGLCMRDSDDPEQRLKVFFELPDGSVKAILPSRVPEHETAYAMTIHKSQGSEFDFTLMLLPAEFTPILTKELIYTGITRAKKQLALYADMKVLKRGVRVKTQRISGLVERLS